MTKILFTGATGFVGNHIRNELEKTDNRILFLTAEGEQFVSRYPHSESISIDLQNIVHVKDQIQSFDPDVCIHCAWQGIPDYSEEVSKLNLLNSIALVDILFKETNCRKLIVSGSCFEYGKVFGKCTESETGMPTQFLTWAKQSLYNYANLLANKNNRNLIWYRMFYVYGPYQRKEALIPSLVSSFHNNVKPRISKPFNANDFIYMPDAAKAYVLALDKNIPSGIYNIGSGISTKVIDVCRLAEKKIKNSTTFSDEIEKEGDKTQDTNFFADTHKTKLQLGFAVEKTIDEGISFYIQHLKNERK